MPRPNANAAVIPREIRALGDAIRWLREKRRMTLRALARAVELSAPFISDLEHNRRTTSHLDRIAKALDVPLSELEERRGLTPDLADWLNSRPDILALLRLLRNSRNSQLILRGSK
jgi:transcriptional regulator with XRE-family HTH domain